jgi:hypothetical protein
VGGTGRGVFTVAGTVYRSGGGAQTMATVNIFPQGSNTAQATMTVDGLGNFWTTQTVAALVPAPGQTLVQGVRAVIQPVGGTSAAMLGVISNGSCNACHSTGGGVPRVTAQSIDTGTVRPAAAVSGEGSAPIAVAIPSSTPMLAHIATGENHACVAKSDGSVLCWNSGATPVAVLALADITALAATGDDTCARTGSGTYARSYCWNASLPGSTTRQFNSGDADAPAALLALDTAKSLSSHFTAPAVAGLAGTTFVQVSSAGNRSCGITTDDRVKCWEGTHASVDVPL